MRTRTCTRLFEGRPAGWLARWMAAWMGLGASMLSANSLAQPAGDQTRRGQAESGQAGGSHVGSGQTAGGQAGDTQTGGGEPLTQVSEGLMGYIHMNAPTVEGFGLGVSFYTPAWPLVESPLADFQIGLPSMWVIPENRTFEEPLCPIGTLPRDHWPERGPSYRDVFQTIEGSLGFWASTQFGSATAKYRMNGTANCYSNEVSSPGWGFGVPEPLRPEQMGLVQLSNRLLVPPDGMTFKAGTFGELFGTAWMALPLIEPRERGAGGVPVGDQAWTLFINAANFKGAVAFWMPDVWTRIASNYPTAVGRTLDTRQAIIDSGAMEIGAVPMFVGVDAKGVEYTRVPRLQFPVDAAGRTVMMQDFTVYNSEALGNAVRAWLGGGAVADGRFAAAGARVPKCSTDPISVAQGEKRSEIKGIDAWVETTMLGPGSYGLTWKQARGVGNFPEYFRREGETLVAVPAADVPESTRLKSQTFAAADKGGPYSSPGSGVWTEPGPVQGPFTATLSDGTTVTYSWYRFVDQPVIRAQKLGEAELMRLQAAAELIHAHWSTDRDYIAPPSSGTLATLDPAMLVTPPRGLERGYVPIVTRQEVK